MTIPSAVVVPDERASVRRGLRARRGSRKRPPAATSRTAGYFFVAFYVVLLLSGPLGISIIDPDNARALQIV